jgi:hypothetical protein
MIRAKEEIERKFQQRKKRKMVAGEKKVQQKLNRDERRMGSLLAVESGQYKMVTNYRMYNEVELDEDEDEDDEQE